MRLMQLMQLHQPHHCHWLSLNTPDLYQSKVKAACVWPLRITKSGGASIWSLFWVKGPYTHFFLWGGGSTRPFKNLPQWFFARWIFAFWWKWNKTCRLLAAFWIGSLVKKYFYTETSKVCLDLQLEPRSSRRKKKIWFLSPEAGNLNKNIVTEQTLDPGNFHG